jgi:tetratricopeptide (TPR) repeat protein
MFRASEAAWQRQDFSQSIELLERATKLNPEDPCVYLDLGRAQGLRYDYDAARKSFEKAVRVSRWHIQSFIAAGLHCANFRQLNMAEDYFKRALQRNGQSAQVLLELGMIEERRQNLAKAAELVGQSLAIEGKNATASLVQARIERGLGRLETAENIIRQSLQLSGTEPEARANAWYELGGILDRQKRFDEAMTAFLEAKSLLRPTAEKFLERLPRNQARLAELREKITAGHLQRWQQAGSKLPSARAVAFMCGHPRSGTTLLEQVLDAHPGIISSEETMIFSTDAYEPLCRSFPEQASDLDILEAAPDAALQLARRNYLGYTEKFLGQPVGNRLLLDKNPAINPLIPAIVRILPETKFIVAIRDPRDVCLSCFMQPLDVNQISSAYLSLDGTTTQYASVMSFWKALQPRLHNPAMEVHYEELVENLESVARRTLDFLGVAWDERVLRFNEHAKNKIIRSPTYADVSKPVFKTAIGRWHNYQKYLEPSLEKLEPFVKTFGYEPS